MPLRVDVPNRRSSVEQTADGVRYAIPAQRNLGYVIFTPLWLIFWVWGEMSSINEIRAAGIGSVFTVVWLIGWTAGGFWAVYVWLACLFGREIVTLTPSILSIQRRVFGFEPASEYDLAAIRDLRFSPVAEIPQRRAIVIFKRGDIAFDYGAKTVRFGGGIDESEAKSIVADLKNRHHFSA
jgi:hypothetical protein